MRFSAFVISVLATLATGCANLQRSLVFSTGTTIGLETAISTQSESPVKIVLGYKRGEVLFDPIMDDVEGSGSAKYKILPEAHSVMAKLLGRVKTSAKSSAGPNADAGFGVAQWFASGKAALIIAENGGAAALTDNPNVADAVARAATLATSEGKIPDIVFSLSNQLYQELKKLGSDANMPLAIQNQARQLHQSLDGSELVGKVPSSFARYIPGAAPAPAGTINFKQVEGLKNPGTGFQKVLTYRSELAASVSHLKKIREATLDGSITISDETPNPPVNADKDAKDKLLKAYESQNADLEAWEKAVAKDSQLISMWRFLGGD